MAQSYLKTGNIHNAIRCFEQELVLDEGNYFTYLQLADLYGREGKLEKAEESLKNLLSRDPENIQGLHQLISHYESHNPAIDTGLLRKRLLGVRKKFTWAEAVIRACHLCAGKRQGEALEFLSAWQAENHPVAEVHLARSHVLGELKRPGDRKTELDAFKKLCGSRIEVMKEHAVEFGRLFGEDAALALLAGIENKSPRRVNRS
jgi:tetratricopeptide (TPR) repeat protein